MLTKGHSMHRGRPKNSSSCVSVEYSSQATTANPHFFGSRPPLLISRGWSRFIYFCYDVVAKWKKKMLDIITKLCYNAQRKIMKNLLKFIVMLLRKIEKILQKTGR